MAIEIDTLSGILAGASTRSGAESRSVIFNDFIEVRRGGTLAGLLFGSGVALALLLFFMLAIAQVGGAIAIGVAVATAACFLAFMAIQLRRGRRVRYVRHADSLVVEIEPTTTIVLDFPIECNHAVEQETHYAGNIRTTMYRETLTLRGSNGGTLSLRQTDGYSPPRAGAMLNGLLGRRTMAKDGASAYSKGSDDRAVTSYGDYETSSLEQLTAVLASLRE